MSLTTDRLIIRNPMPPTDRRTRSRIAIAALVLVLAGFAWFAFRPRPVPVDLARVGLAPLVVTVNEDGRARLRERYTVSSPLGGQLDRIVLRAGDEVVAGETTLAMILPSVPELLDPRVRAQAEARLRSAEAAELASEARLERARVDERHARIELERGEELHERNVIPLQQLEALEQALQVAASEVRAAEFGRRVAEFETEQARAVLEQTGDAVTRPPPSEGPDGDGNAAGDEPDRRYRIVSPVSGRILRVLEESATVVQPGTPILEVGDPSDLEIEVDVLSQDAVRIVPGARVMITHWGGDPDLAGRVRIVEPSAFTKVSALGVEEQRVNVIADFVSPPEERATLGDGFRVEARIVTWEGEDVLQVPVGALFRIAGEWAVFAVEDGRAVTRRIAVGHRNESAAEVLDGLAPDEQVVLYPGDRVRDKVRVRPRTDGKGKPFGT